jgi:subtilisin family serine protease
MILKYYDPHAPGVENLENTVRAIKYAIQMKAHIINYSGGGLEFSQPEYNAIAEAQRQNILVVAAAGNEQSNSDKTKYYPADYDLDNIISVTAVDPKTQILASSNYGVETVDIAAPGEDIYSTLPGGDYGTMTGTSQATAFVSGLAALILSNNDSYKPRQIKKYILATGDRESQLVSKTGTSRRLNIYKALINIDSDVSANGTIAENIHDIGPFTLSQAEKRTVSGSGVSGLSSAHHISAFGRSLMDSVNRGEKSP